jgi:hypothetical protein
MGWSINDWFYYSYTCYSYTPLPANFSLSYFHWWGGATMDTNNAISSLHFKQVSYFLNSCLFAYETVKVTVSQFRPAQRYFTIDCQIGWRVFERIHTWQTCYVGGIYALKVKRLLLLAKIMKSKARLLRNVTFSSFSGYVMPEWGGLVSRSVGQTGHTANIKRLRDVVALIPKQVYSPKYPKFP